MIGLNKISFFLILLLSSYAVCQSKESKLIRKNNDARFIQYTTDRCYSRSIFVYENFVYTANSNGSVYKTDLKSDSSVNILQGSSFEELRDLYYHNGILTAVQSGTTGKLIRTNTKRLLGEYAAKNDQWKQLFIDGVDLKDAVGFLMGDPIEGKFQLFKSTDYGINWLRCEGTVDAMEGEAGFAASGTNVQVINDSTFVFVSGGKKSRFFRSNDRGKSWLTTSLPYMNSESSGAFSICMIDTLNGVIVGGDYKNPDLCMNTCFYTDDGGKFWMNAETQTRGYRSCVIYSQGVFYCCGTNGIDYSTDGGQNWKPFANGIYMALYADSQKLYATRPNGSFQIFELIEK
jgi:photosystem II stability/assembly factor-like uncharacterized protein